MCDFETQSRNPLRGAVTLPVPGASLDQDRLAAQARAAPDGRPVPRRWLAVAGIFMVAGLVACSEAPSVPATPPAQATATVDLNRGQQNPHVPLDPDVADELYLMISDHKAAGEVIPAEPPKVGPGFGGLVVAPADPTLPQLRILPTAVYVDDPDRPGRIDDPASGFYNRVYDAVLPLLDEPTRTALPDSNPPIPTVTATVPPRVGSPAIWTLANPNDLTRASATITINVTRLECSSGKTGAIARPVVSVSDDDIIIRADAEPLPDDSAQTCPDNDSVAVTVPLPEPIGDRPLIDAACLERPALRTSHCQSGATRWTP